MSTVDLTVSPKRVPRTHLSDSDWSAVLETYHGACAVCGRSPEEKGFQQDHKVPRLRGGGDELENWQPLCDECNNFKSTSCRDCRLDCSVCSWAYPEKYKPIRISADLILKIRKRAGDCHVAPEKWLSDLIEAGLSE